MKRTHIPHVLVVDDVADFVDRIADILTAIGLRVTVQQSPLKAIKDVKHNKYDLLITTLVMRELGGLELIRGVRQQGSTVPIMIITGFGSEQAAIEATRLGALDFLSNNSNASITQLKLANSGNFDAVGTIYVNDKIYTTGTLTKSGSGLLELLNSSSNGTNISGGIIITGGSLLVGSGSALGYSPASASVPQLTFNNSSTLYVTSTAGFGANRTFNIATGATANINSDGTTAIFQLSNSLIGGGSLVVSGTGSVVLNGTNNSYLGTTNISSGTLGLNTSSGIPSTSPLSIGGNLLVYPGYNGSQSFPSVTLNPGSTSTIITSTLNKSSQSLALGSINRSTGAVIDLTLPSVGTITTATLNANYSGGQATILGGYATTNSQTSWATSAATTGTPGVIAPLTTFDQTFNATGADVDVVSTTNLNPTVASVNSIRFNDGSNSYSISPSATLSIATGGILITANVGSNFDGVSGGSITSGNGTDLIIFNANTNGFFSINSTIVDAASGPIGLTTSGAGKTQLFSANTFSGPTYVNGASLQLYNQFALQNSTLAGGTVIFEPTSANYNIGGIGTSSTISLNDSNGNAITLAIGGNNASTTFSGIFTGAGTLIKNGTGTTYLSNGNSTFSGGFIINGGLIQFGTGAAFGDNNNGSQGLNPVVINNGAGILYTGTGASNYGTQRGFTLGGGNDTIEIGSLTTATNTSSSSLTIGASNYTGGTLIGPASGTALLTKTGLGTLVLINNATYNGGTNVAEGTLTAYSTNSLGVSTLGGNYTGQGPLAIIPTSLFATVNLEAVAPQISSLTSYINGNASGGTASLVLGFPVVGDSTTLSIGADNTSTTYSGSISDRNANYSGAVGNIIKVGTGSLTLSGVNTYAGYTNVSSGSLVLGSSTALPVANNLQISAGATVVASATTSTYALQLNTLSNSGLLDLTKNAAVIHSGSSISSVTALVSQGYNGGLWKGSTGITSSTAAGDSSHLTALGVIANDSVGTPLYGSGGSIASTFEGATPVDGDILLKYTYYGDANLDGKVDGSDYSRIDNEYLLEQTTGSISGWFNGDFNYDGVINGSDYTLIDNAFNMQGAVLSSQIASPLASATAQLAGVTATSAVPEPASISLLALATIGLLGTRRRRQ